MMIAQLFVSGMLILAVAFTVADIIKHTPKKRFISNIIWLLTSFANSILLYYMERRGYSTVWAVLGIVYAVLVNRSFKVAFPDKTNENSNNSKTF